MSLADIHNLWAAEPLVLKVRSHLRCQKLGVKGCTTKLQGAGILREGTVLSKAV